MRGSYPEAWFLSRTAVPIQKDGRWIDTTHRQVAHATTRALGVSPVHGQPVRMSGRAYDRPRMSPPHVAFRRTGDANHTAHTPHVTRTSHNRTRHTPTTHAYKTRPDQPVRARNVFGSGVRTLAVVRAVLTTIATLTTPLRHVILLGFVV